MLASFARAFKPFALMHRGEMPLRVGVPPRAAVWEHRNAGAGCCWKTNRRMLSMGFEGEGVSVIGENLQSITRPSAGCSAGRINT